MEAYGHLVGPAVFKTDVTRSAGQGGSIPLRLRHQGKTRLQAILGKSPV
jgi:hypothetical protein